MLPGLIDALETERTVAVAEAFTLRHDRCPTLLRAPTMQTSDWSARLGRYTVFWALPLERVSTSSTRTGALEGIVPLLVPLLDYFRQARRDGESFGDFCQRKGADDLRARGAQGAGSDA